MLGGATGIEAAHRYVDEIDPWQGDLTGEVITCHSNA